MHCKQLLIAFAIYAFNVLPGSDVLRIYVFMYVVNLFSFGKILLFFLSKVSILDLLTVLIFKISNNWRILAFFSNASDRGSGWLAPWCHVKASFIIYTKWGSVDHLHISVG